MSGWAQIHGGDFLNPEQKLILDYWYIQNMSLWLDIRIVVKTLIVMFAGTTPALDMVEQCRSMIKDINLSPQPMEKENSLS